MRDARTKDFTFYAEPVVVLGDDFSRMPTVATGLASGDRGEEILLSVYDTHERAELMLTRSEARLLGRHLLEDFGPDGSEIPGGAARPALAIVRPIRGGDSA
ncbi:hypothetical protein CH274_13520 [Rhodococcus sp. 06-418-5]|uniref:hypothetical protein n=1 Tax=Rhodococcus sp. 06-418-5 TaxID=2022507 RepID=UPI000B9B3F6D|nr:hypothetical protein [Rhodococcus sp. 06-418-5]OZC80249.1 hypothetical protein CH274_13520 [Rhodococcus sp. 06-418-5]